MSISGGLENAILSGQEIGCTAIAMFVKSNRQWGSKKLTKREILTFKQTWQDSCVIDIVAHSSYLTNLGSPDIATYHRSIASLVNELQLCNALGIEYLVLHPGSHLDSGEKACIKKVSQAIDGAFDIVNGKSDEEMPRYLEPHKDDEKISEKDLEKACQKGGKTKLLIETMAGQGTSIGHKFEQIAEIFENVKNKKNVGVCFDTCHSFAAGYDFTTKSGYENVIKEFDRAIGLKNLMAMHINDSKKDLGSCVDRHEEIGDGKLGLDPFSFIFNDERLFDIPKVLETPEGTLKSYAKNMEIIKGLLSSKTKKFLHVK